MLLSDDTVFIYYTGLYTNIKIYCKIYTKSKLNVKRCPKYAEGWISDDILLYDIQQMEIGTVAMYVNMP